MESERVVTWKRISSLEKMLPKELNFKTMFRLSSAEWWIMFVVIQSEGTSQALTCQIMCPFFPSQWARES